MQGTPRRDAAPQGLSKQVHARGARPAAGSTPPQRLKAGGKRRAPGLGIEDKGGLQMWPGNGGGRGVEIAQISAGGGRQGLRTRFQHKAGVRLVDKTHVDCVEKPEAASVF